MTWMPDGEQTQTRAEPMLTVRVEVAAAQAVYLLAPFNNWSTTATLMRRTADGAWESALPTQEVARLAFFVWWTDQPKGQLLWGGRRRGPTHRPLEGGNGGATPGQAANRLTQSIGITNQAGNANGMAM